MVKKKNDVVIAGGGFAGVKAALELAEEPQFKVTLISNYPDMKVYGSLYHTATGGSNRVSMIPLSEIFKDKPVQIIIDTVQSIDRKKHQITTVSGKNFNYTGLILAIGVRTSYFGIKGLEEYSFGIKSLEEAYELKRHLHTQLLDKNSQNLHYIVVGGGPTGVEIAGVLPQYLSQIAKFHGLPKRSVHVDLIEGTSRLLPRMPKDVSWSVTRNLKKLGVRIYLKTFVQGQTANQLMINGKQIRSHTVIWTAGMSNNPFFSANNFQLTASGKVRVDQFLQAEPGIYVLGDNADTAYAGMAQTALHDGLFVAEHLKRLANGQDPIPYRSKKPVYVMPAGPKWAAVVWGRFRVYGRLGWAIRRAADLRAFKDYESWPLTFSRFIAEYDKEEFCPVCADDLSLPSS